MQLTESIRADLMRNLLTDYPEVEAELCALGYPYAFCVEALYKVEGHRNLKAYALAVLQDC